MPRTLAFAHGQRFGRLTVLGRTDQRARCGVILWLCRCDCGREPLARADQLAGGKTRSCGCAWRAALRATLVARNHRHGGYGSRLYRIWAMLRERCNSPGSRDYKNFGARGVSVCEAWNDFSGFRAWALDNGYADNLSVALIDRAGNFEPANCRWARSHNYRPPKKHLVEAAHTNAAVRIHAPRARHLTGNEFDPKDGRLTMSQ